MVRSDTCPPPKYQAVPDFALKGDSLSALLSIPPRVLLICDVCSFYMYKISEFGDYDIRMAYEKLCDEGFLKDEYKVIEKKGLAHALEFP